MKSWGEKRWNKVANCQSIPCVCFQHIADFNSDFSLFRSYNIINGHGLHHQIWMYVVLMRVYLPYCVNIIYMTEFQLFIFMIGSYRNLPGNCQQIKTKIMYDCLLILVLHVHFFKNRLNYYEFINRGLHVFFMHK